MSELQNRLAVVTGAANGIGLACARQLAAAGAHVCLVDIDAAALDAACGEIRAAGGTAHPFRADLLQRDAIEAVFAAIAREAGPVDILVNNVGGSARKRSSEYWCADPDVIEYVITLNLLTTMRCTRQVVAGMRERRRGKIVNISSDAAFNGDPNIADYAAAKAGILGFTRSLASEMAKHRVNVNAVCPGATETKAAEEWTPEVRAFAASAPLGAMCQPDDIANAVSYLVSDKARYMTGHVMVVNGGRAYR
jgi:acetoacetyl-CoA reductase/3-oxoacyl-[acyl-carrier protein] reductase